MSDFRGRCDDVKDKVRYPEVADALDINTAAGDECPVCKKHEMRACADGRGYHCKGCGSTGSMIDLVMRVRQWGLGRAVPFLEEIAAAPADRNTGDLFSSDAATSGGGKRDCASAAPLERQRKDGARKDKTKNGAA